MTRCAQAIDRTTKGHDGKPAVETMVNEAKRLIQVRQFNEAVALLHEALEFHPDYPDGYVQLGRAEANLGRLDKAEVRLLAIICFYYHLLSSSSSSSSSVQSPPR